MATLKVRSKTDTTITVYITGLDTNYSNKERNVYWSCDDSTVYVYPAKSTIENGISQTDDIELSGFSAGTTYTITARVTYYDADGTTYTVDLTATTTTASSGTTRPAKFSWVKSTVVKGKDAIIYATEWNDLTANINDVRDYKGLSSYSFTKAVPNNDFTADIYNEAVTAIKGISGYGTSLSKVSKGDDFNATLLNNIVSAINAVT